MQNNNEKIVKALGIFRRAQSLHAAKQYAAASEAYRQAIALVPKHPGFITGYAQLAEDVRDWKAGEALYRELGRISPDSGFEGKLGVMLFNQGRHRDAIPFLGKHLARQPGHPDLLWSLAYCCQATGDFTRALVHAEPLWQQEHSVRAARVLASCLSDLGRAADLDRLAPELLTRCDNDAQVSGIVGWHLLKSGDLAGGFDRLAAIRACYDPDRPTFRALAAPQWDGRRFDGTLLVTAEQGLGEEILASSLYDDLLALGQRCVIEADPRLLPLFRRTWPSLVFVSRHEPALQAASDDGSECRKCLALDIAAFFRRDVAAFPARRGWLLADGARREALRARYVAAWPGQRLAGISWKSRREFTGSDAKSVPLTAFVQTLATPGWRFINLQYGDVDTDLAAVGERTPYVDPDIDSTNDLDALAAQVAALDLVVTTSNTTAHLAGALGVATHVALPRCYPVLWYWGYSGTTTPWYPAITLHRNDSDDDWQALDERLSRIVHDAGPAAAPS